MRARGLQAMMGRAKKRRRPDEEVVGRVYFLTRQMLRVSTRWLRMHMNLQCPYGKVDAYRGVIGGGSSYRFTPTSIGTLISIHCDCGVSLYLGEEGDRI